MGQVYEMQGKANALLKQAIVASAAEGHLWPRLRLVEGAAQ